MSAELLPDDDGRGGRPWSVLDLTDAGGAVDLGAVDRGAVDRDGDLLARALLAMPPDEPPFPPSAALPFPPSAALPFDPAPMPAVELAGTRGDGPGDVVDPTAVQAQLARAAAELADLVEHHRRELSDTMAELTRLQREMRAETRAAVEQLREVARAEAAAPDHEPAAAPSPAFAVEARHPRRRGRLGFLKS